MTIAAAASAPSSTSAANASEPDLLPSGPTRIDVPYLGTATIEPAEGWQISDCTGPVASSPLVVACDATRIELAATGFDPDADPVTIPVGLTNGRTDLAFDYVVATAPPEAPSVTPTRPATPVAAGSVSLVPISDLGVECTVCAERGALEVVDVRPATAGSAIATSTHVVFRAAAGYAGEAEIVIRFVDDFGTASPESTLVIPVTRPGPAELIALNVFAPLDPAGSTTVDLASLVFSNGDAEVFFTGCGAPVHGGVVCGADGIAEYTTLADVAVDQFGFAVASADGEQSTGSVTLVRAGGDLPTEGLVPASGRVGGGAVAAAVVPARPVGPRGDERAGLFASLIGILDRVGAR
ncbi:hypothetical protein [Agromyces sp. H66]|uniref:hypothetical protein n=1 Tax=Agromyces sp. H66 TaxID=2529859 RepID=UPI00145BD821|nr:hypothetical protein [Agromyces sp. H66]